MYLSNRVYMIAGLVLIGIAICLALGIGLSMAVSSEDSTSKADTAKYLKDLYDNTGLYIGSQVAFLLLDSILTPLVGIALYLTFRDRSKVLAVTIMIAFASSAAVGTVNDGINLMAVVLAKDFAHGGAGLNAGDPGILELTHIMSWATTLIGQAQVNLLGIAFLSLAAVLLTAPAGNVNPPRAIGWFVLIAGLSFFLSWTVALTDAGFVFFIINGIAVIIFTLWLGIWLISNSSKLPVPEGSSA